MIFMLYNEYHMPIPLCRNAHFFVHSGANLQFFMEKEISREILKREAEKEGINIMYRKFLFGHRPARQCLSEQNDLDNLDSKK